jgi:hypothetical protein
MTKDIQFQFLEFGTLQIDLLLSLSKYFFSLFDVDWDIDERSSSVSFFPKRTADLHLRLSA